MSGLPTRQPPGRPERPAARRPVPGPGVLAGTPASARVWYLSYGSNMHLARLAAYLAGGRPRGAARSYPGCRDPRPPERSVPAVLPGGVHFALESPVWTGGVAFWDPDADGETWARAHLLTAQQFFDVAAQEMHRPPGSDLDLTEVLATGRAEVGPGAYETLLCPGLLDGLPVLTFTAPWSEADVRHNPPSARYLRHIASGLLEAGAWDAAEVDAYLTAAASAPTPAPVQPAQDR